MLHVICPTLLLYTVTLCSSKLNLNQTNQSWAARVTVKQWRTSSALFGILLWRSSRKCWVCINNKLQADHWMFHETHRQQRQFISLNESRRVEIKGTIIFITVWTLNSNRKVTTLWLFSASIWAPAQWRLNLDFSQQLPTNHVSYKEMSSQREEEDSCSCGGAAVLLCFVSGRPEGSSLYQLWTLVLQTVHQLILGPVCFIRTLLLSPVWTKIQNKSWTADSQSEQLCPK